MIFCDNRTGLSCGILIKPSWLMIAFLEKWITCIGMIALIMRLSCNDFKIWKLVEDNCKLYVFVWILIVVIVNIWISLFIKLCNLYFLRNTLRKIQIHCNSVSTIFDPSFNQIEGLLVFEWVRHCLHWWQILKASYGDLVRNMCHLPQPRGPIFKIRFLRLNTHL